MSISIKDISSATIAQLIEQGHALADQGNYADSETCLEHALMRQNALNGDKDNLQCFDILCDLAYIAGLRGRDGRKAVQLQRAMLILLNQLNLLDGNRRPHKPQTGRHQWQATSGGDGVV